MPPVKKDDYSNRSIKDFFKPFTIPKNSIPANDVIEEEIVVAAPKPSSPSDNLRARKPSHSPRGRNDWDRNPKSSRSSSALSSLSSTPTTQSTPRTTPKQRAPVSRLDIAKDGPLIHINPSLSQRRVMSAVEIPSPKPKAPDLKPEEAPPRPPTTSLSSISTLSSVPISTQSSSRRIIKNGIQAITNSDSGSAESSDEEELADASTFVPRKRAKLTPSPPAGQDKDHALEIPSTVKPSTRRSVRATEGSGVSTPRRDDSPPPTKPAYRHSLLNLVKQREKEQKAERRMREMEEEFAEVERKREEHRVKEREAMSGLKAAVADDSDEGERMMLAMQRTGALEGEEKFFYFGGGVKENGIDEDSLCHCLDQSYEIQPRPWILKLKDAKWRIQACLSGFVAELAGRDGLPRPMREWMMWELLHEERKDLREAYIGILEACGNGELEDKNENRCMCHGRESPRLCDFYHVQFDNTKPSSVSGPPPNLAFLVRVVRHCSILADESAIASALSELIFTNIDANVEADASLKGTIEDSIEHLLGHASGLSQDGVYSQAQNTFIFLDSLQLKCRAIAALPAFSERSHALRRRLALHLIIGHDVGDTFTIPTEGFGELLRSPRHAEAILFRLKKAPVFGISESTDYSLLNHLIQVLDIAIDSGFSSPSELLVNHAQPQKNVNPSTLEKSFNAQIDAFITQLYLMASRIRDAGTTHLQRTQAKSAIERLAKRLEYGVRTKPRPRKGIFSNGAVIEEGQRGFLKGFLKLADSKGGEVDEVDGESAALGAAAD